MSRGIAFLRQRDSFSVLLSQIRNRVSYQRFRTLLALQITLDRWLERRYIGTDFEIFWSQESEVRIEKAFDALRQGENMMPSLGRIIHLYGHLFWGLGHKG